MREKVINFITQFPERDDDEISAALQIRPRQTINQICRKLEKAGLIERARGASGKIVNRIASQAFVTKAPVPRDRQASAGQVRAVKPTLSIDALDRRPPTCWLRQSRSMDFGREGIANSDRGVA